MRRFLINITLFLSPAIAFSVYLVVLFFNHNLHIKGDFSQPNRIIGEPYTNAYPRNIKYYHNIENYEVICIGSSRVLEFTENMFEDRFFNLGYMTRSVFQIPKLIESRDIRNKTIIIGIDQWCFDKNWHGFDEKELVDIEYSLLELIGTRNKVDDIIKGKVALKSARRNLNFELIGSGANMAFEGLIHDGSFYYGKKINELLQRDESGVVEHVDNAFIKSIVEMNLGNPQTSTADPSALNCVKNIIETCKSRDIKLILFFPPLSPSINAYIIESDGYGYIKDAADNLRDICSSTDSKFFDFTNIYSMNNEYIDHFHAGQFVYYRMMQNFDVPHRVLYFDNPFESNLDSALTKARVDFFRN